MNFTSYEQVIINDLIHLLETKGFKRFKNFAIDVIVDKSNSWEFGGQVNIKFDFRILRTVEKVEYYEFG